MLRQPVSLWACVLCKQRQVPVCLLAVVESRLTAWLCGRNGAQHCWHLTSRSRIVESICQPARVASKVHTTSVRRVGVVWAFCMVTFVQLYKDSICSAPVLNADCMRVGSIHGLQSVNHLVSGTW